MANEKKSNVHQFQGKPRPPAAVPGNSPQGNMPVNPATGQPFTPDEIKKLMEDQNSRMQDAIDRVNAAFAGQNYMLIGQSGIITGGGDILTLHLLGDMVTKDLAVRVEEVMRGRGWRGADVLKPAQPPTPSTQEENVADMVKEEAAKIKADQDALDKTEEVAPEYPTLTAVEDTAESSAPADPVEENKVAEDTESPKTES